MPLYPHAIQKGPVPPTNYALGGTPKIGVVNHVSEGTAQSAINTFLSPNSFVSAHFVIDLDGTVYQLLDTDLCCYAQASGNYPPTAYVAIEYAGFSTGPMTTAQVLSGAAVTAWLSSTHNFPLMGVVAHGQPGVTCHCNPDGTPDFNWGGHVCPGAIRLAQVPGIIYIAWLVQHPTPAGPPPVFKKVSTDMAAAVPTGGVLISRPDGSVYAEQGAAYHGSAGQYNPALPPGGANVIHISAPIVGIAPTRTGGGYWMVGIDGAVYAFGDAGYHGSGTGNPGWGIGTAANPVTGIALDMSKANGYCIVADSGGPVPATYFCNETANYS